MCRKTTHSHYWNESFPFHNHIKGGRITEKSHSGEFTWRGCVPKERAMSMCVTLGYGATQESAAFDLAERREDTLTLYLVTSLHLAH